MTRSGASAGSSGGGGNTSGTDGSPVPSEFTVVGGSDGTNAQVMEMKNGAPAGTEYGVIVRNISTEDVAHDAADAGKPVKTGARAVNFGATPTAVAALDRTDDLSTRTGIKFVQPGHPNIVTVAAAYTAAQDDTAIVTVSAGTRIVLLGFFTRADNANTVDVGFYAGFAAANTPTTTGVVDTHPGVAPGSGTSVTMGGAPIGIGGDGEDLRIDCEVPTGGSFRVIAKYYTEAV